ncbi:MFS transporter [Nanchangia anserum]|uniref:MFS transporter n=1 Tax=Nanchangia anserum TaxID=2692125 RepID=UPI0018840A40|nr:MFS transporter [Nanchangia anserum]QOX81274.1 MFS transporter [Nanchangia anserum]
MIWKRHVAFLLTSQAISLLGSSIVQSAMIWHITLVTTSGSAIALASVAAFLPLVIVSPLAGVWADRYNRRVITVAADAAVAVATAGIFVAFVLGHRSLTLMCVVLAIRSCATAFQSPAVTSLLPGFVPEDHLMRVNGLSGSVQALSNILGPALGGVALALMPLHMVFLIDIATAIIGITLFGSS